MGSTTWRDETLTLIDGIKLQSRIWMPKEGKAWPALIMRQPYGRELGGTITYLHPTWWASHGYLVVVQDVRGQGGSGGTFKGFKQEASDTSQTHKWVRSLKECNGRIGTYGFSYQGLTQLLAEPGTTPPDCLAPAMTGLNEREHWCCDGGAFWWHIGMAWGIQLAALQARRKEDWDVWKKLRNSLDNGSYLIEGPLLLQKHDPEGMVLKWLRHTNENQKFWEIHKPQESWLRKPMLLIGGWWDPHLKGVIDLYHQSVAAGGKPELHIGPATHLEWWEESQEILLNFFNTHLKPNKEPNKHLKQPLLWNLTSSEWESYNPSNQRIRSWALCSKGSACLSTTDGQLLSFGEGDGSLEIVHDPWRPVPSIGGHLSPIPGKGDRGSIDKRPDVATFQSEPFKETFKLVGIPLLELIAQSDQRGFDLCAAISIVKKDLSEVEQISTGFLRMIGKDSSEPIKRRVIFQAVLAQLNKGEVLRLSIAGSSWPAIGINPGQSNQPCQAPSPHCQTTTISMDFSESKLQFLPLISKKDLHEGLESA